MAIPSYHHKEGQKRLAGALQQLLLEWLAEQQHLWKEGEHLLLSFPTSSLSSGGCTFAPQPPFHPHTAGTASQGHCWCFSRGCKAQACSKEKLEQKQQPSAMPAAGPILPPSVTAHEPPASAPGALQHELTVHLHGLSPRRLLLPCPCFRLRHHGHRNVLPHLWTGDQAHASGAGACSRHAQLRERGPHPYPKAHWNLSPTPLR